MSKSNASARGLVLNAAAPARTGRSLHSFVERKLCPRQPRVLRYALDVAMLGGGSAG